MATRAFFFLGFKVDSDLNNRLDACDESERFYLEEPEYLEKIQVDDSEFIGRKLTSNGIHPENISDNAKNIVSLLKRVIPTWSIAPSTATLLAIEEETLPEHSTI